MSDTTSTTPASADQNRLPAGRTSATALTALFVAQGVAATVARADLAADEAAKVKAIDAVKLEAFDVSEAKENRPVSPKFTAPLLDTPQTVVVIPSEVFNQQGAASLSDALRNTAGITFAAGEGGSATATSGDSFYMRGFDTSNNIFVDGVRDVGAYSRDVFNLEQIEVAKGPAGSDIGRGGASGYVNVSTKVPRLERFVAGTVSYGFDEQTSGTRRRTTLDLNETASSSPIKGTAFRLNALWQDNDAVGRDYANNSTWSIAPSLALGLGTPTRAILAYQHTEQDNLPDYGLTTALLPGYNPAKANPSILPPYAPIPVIDRSTFFGLTSDFDKVTVDAVTARVEHDFNSDLKLSNQTRYSANQREAAATTPGTSGTAYAPVTGLLTRSRQANKRDLAILSNQTNASGRFETGTLRHSFSTGLELTRETAYSPAFTSITLPAILLTAINPESVVALPPRSGAYTDVVTKTAGLYVIDSIKFNEQWQANASIRGDRYHTHYLSVAATGLPTTADARHGLFSYKGGLVFKPVKAGSIYVAYATSLTPPGTDFTLSSAAGNQNNPDSDPQKTTNLEAGVKWDFLGGRLSTTAAVFKTVNDKTVFNDVNNVPVAAGKQTVQGFELGLSRRFTDNWIVLGSLSFLDSEINQGTTTGGNPAGSSLPLIPKWSGNLYTSYRFGSGLIVGGGGQYSDAVMRRDNNNLQVPRKSPSFWVFNANVSYPVTRNLNLRFNVNNLFDRVYVASANNNGARFNPAAPRAYLLSADFKF